MKKSAHYELGRKGEAAAVKYLKAAKFKVMETNFRAFCGEIDIIAAKKKTLFFIEIKTRSSLSYGCPAEAVSKKKQARLIKTAQVYLQQEKNVFDEYVFSVMELTKSDDAFDIVFIEEAFFLDEDNFR